MPAESNKRLKLTLIRSVFGRLESHKACAKGLGLTKMHSSVEVNATPEIRGMINKINYLLKIEEA